MKWLTLLFAIFSLSISAASAHGGLHVSATTSILADVASRIGSPQIEVYPLVPANADVHAYEPTTDDIALVAQSDMLLTVGAGYETFLGGLLENAGSDVPVVEVSAGIDLLAYGVHEDHEHEECEAEHEDEEHVHAGCDPHVWMNPRNVIVWVNNIADAFAESDVENASLYRANAEAYIAELEALDEEIQQIVSAVPEEQRTLVTNHEFLGYFAHAYGFEVAATVLPGGSTAAELDPQSLAALIELVHDENVPAIFAEVSANPQLAQLIADEAGITVVTTLYSESLGDADSPAATYLDMMRYNAQTIADALGG